MALERPKHIKTGADAREALMAGFGHTARLAGLTLGPHGGRVVLERADDFPELTRDGFTAIRDLEDEDRFATLGTELLKACVKKTRDAVGDGSTTTALLAGAFAEAGLRLVAAGIDPPTVRRGFDRLTREALAALEPQSSPVSGRAMLAQLAGVAADGDDEIAGLVAEAVERLGAEGVVSISYHQGVDTTVDYMSGMGFEHGLLSRNFLLKAGETEVKLDQPFLLMCQGELTETAQVVPALEAAREAKRSLLVLAQDVSDQALAALLTNHREGTVHCAAAKGPESGIYRHVATDDVAVLTGGRMVGEETGLLPEKIDAAALGSAKRAIVDGGSTTIFGGGGDVGRSGAPRRADSRRHRARAQELRPGQATRRGSPGWSRASPTSGWAASPRPPGRRATRPARTRSTPPAPRRRTVWSRAAAWRSRARPSPSRTAPPERRSPSAAPSPVL